MATRLKQEAILIKHSIDYANDDETRNLQYVYL